MITKWSELLTKYPNAIEYVDVEESESTMIAMRTSDLEKEEEPVLDKNAIKEEEDFEEEEFASEVSPSRLE